MKLPVVLSDLAFCQSDQLSGSGALKFGQLREFNYIRITVIAYKRLHVQPCI